MHIVVNWLWQGVALTVVTELAMRIVPRASASMRYRLWWVTMALVLLLPVLPGLVALSGATAVSAEAAPPISPLPLPAVPVWPVMVAAGCWVSWVAVYVFRLAASVATLNRVRRASTPFPPEREARLAYWRSIQGSGSRTARLVQSDRVRSASVIGLGNALIAVSPEAGGRLNDEELDQVVLHEWAHVQRRDDYARLAQSVVRGVAGMHPAVWWIGRRLEIEREIACDDYAVNVTGAARRLALCLAKLAELHHTPSAVSLAPGVLRASQLTLRVQRLLDPRCNRSTRASHPVLGSAALALTLAAIVLAHVELVAAAPAPMPSVAVPAFPIDREDAAVETPASPEVEGVQPIRTSLPVRSSSASVDDAAQEGGEVSSPSSFSTVKPKNADPAIADAPIDRLGRVAWQLPDLPPLANALSLSTRPHENEEPKIATPWGAAADAGISIGLGSQKAASATADAGTSLGRGSQKAAVATAEFFTKLSRKVAGSF